jgi:hypothetical protein
MMITRRFITFRRLYYTTPHFFFFSFSFYFFFFFVLLRLPFLLIVFLLCKIHHSMSWMETSYIMLPAFLLLHWVLVWLVGEGGGGASIVYEPWHWVFS